MIFVAEPGYSMGSFSFLDERPTDYETLASTNSRILSLEAEPFRDAMTEREAVTQGVVRYLAGVIRGLS